MSDDELSDARRRQRQVMAAAWRRIEEERDWELASPWWQSIRQRGIANREAYVVELLRGPPRWQGCDWLADLLSECGEEFTDRQRMALELICGYGLALREAARLLDRPRSTVRGWFNGATEKVRHLSGRTPPSRGPGTVSRERYSP